MEKRMDEKILDFINEIEEKRLRENICEGPVKINNNFYEFEESEFFDGALKMYIPNTFIDMPEEARRFKYQSEDRPDIIKCNDDGSIAITFKIIDNPLEDEYIDDLKETMVLITKKLNPSNVFFDEGILEIDSKKIAYYDFKSSAIDAYLYNFTFLFEFKGETFMGTFSCDYKDMREWKDDVIFQMINTIKVKKNNM